MKIYKILSLTNAEYLHLTTKRPALFQKIAKKLQDIPKKFIFKNVDNDTLKEIKNSFQTSRIFDYEKED